MNQSTHFNASQHAAFQSVGACIAHGMPRRRAHGMPRHGMPRHVHATHRTSLRYAVATGPRNPHLGCYGSQAIRHGTHCGMWHKSLTTIRHGTCVNDLSHIPHKTKMSAKQNIYSPTTLTNYTNLKFHMVVRGKSGMCAKVTEYAAVTQCARHVRPNHACIHKYINQALAQL